MNARSYLLYLFILITAVARTQDKPNIVLFFIDDWAWNGSSIQMDDEVFNSYISSLMTMPNLEQLASEGMLFSHAYSGAPQCSPSRVALQTGQSSPRNGFTVFMNDGGEDYYDPSNSYSEFPVVPNVSDMTIDPDATTIPEALAPHGYAAAHIGKWHMRGNPDDEGYIMNSGPTTNNEGNENIPGDPKRMFSITDSAIFFIEEQVAADKPFYIQLSHYAMHEGRECLDETRAKYQATKELQDYYKLKGETASSISYKSDPATWLGMAEDLDGRIGIVLDKLKELGIYDNTYIIVTADNGYREDFYEDLFRHPQPLHGAKWWLWQGGLRVMMIARGPDIPANSVCDENVVNYDFLPTFVEWAGGDPGAELTDIDGLSLAPLMRGEPVDPSFSNRTLYFHYPHYRESMPMSVAISGDKKVVHFYERPDIPMYFNIGQDIAEMNNIAESDPAGHEALFNDMMQYLADVGARIPLYPNPNYDSLAYVSADGYDKRVRWGPFTGERSLEEDEYISASEKLFQHLSALSAFISKDASDVVSNWSDLTIKNHNALPDQGSAKYPSESLFESGLSGIDFGSTNTNFELLSALATDTLLDFNGLAGNKDGFAVVMAIRPHTIKDEWCNILGNTANAASENSFGLRFNGSGVLEAYLGGKTIQSTKSISENLTVILGMNYHSKSGKFELFTSQGDTLSVQVSKGDFSNASPIYLGGISSESNGFYNGVIGEIKVYDMALDDEQLFTEADDILRMWTQVAQQELVLHLDASVEESVVTDESGLVSSWLDLSAKEKHTYPLVGALYYPGSSLLESGLPGVDFGNEPNKLELFSREESDAILDFTGDAAKNSGVTVFTVFKIRDFVDNQNDILGNNTSVSDLHGFGLRYDNLGKPRAYMGGSKIVLTHQLQQGETVIYGLNYDKASKQMLFWNSSTGTSETVSVSPDDFSNDDSFALGGTGAKSGDGRYLDGMVGELKVYNFSLSDSAFDEQCMLLEDKWIKPAVSWVQDPFSKSDAIVEQTYIDSIRKEDLQFPEKMNIRFSKVSGPEWLTVSESGELSGTPLTADIGENIFVVRAGYFEDSKVDASMKIQVSESAPEFSWTADPFSKSDAVVDSVYIDSIAKDDYNYESGNGVVLFSKVSGPAWLQISENGYMSGTPSEDDIGVNSFIIEGEIEEADGVEANLLIEVIAGTGLESGSGVNSIIISPNPGVNRISVRGIEKGYFEIFNLLGNKLLEGDIADQIDITSLNKGVYLMVINGSVNKFIKWQE